MDFLKFHPRFSGNRDSGANLKKVLALVLAFACAFTMFAGAAFTDSADIKVDADVVDTLVSLGIVEGFEDGSFQPNGTVTRAQMAKMIYVLRTGNSDASAYNDEKSSFTDINGHWARGYIKYCQSLGIIAGKSATIFAPNANVTAQEAAKMLLVTLGYDAAKAGLTGASWASKTNALADENGLLDDVNTSFTAACPRQYAAQLIYNTIFARTVVLRDGEYTTYGTNNSKNPTVGEKYMGLIEYTDTFEGNSDVISGLKDGEIKVGTQTATYDMDNDLIGEEVTVLFKDHKNGTANVLDTKDKVFGVYATGETKVYRITKDDMQDASRSDLAAGKIKFNDKTYEVVDGAYTAASASTAAIATTIVNKNYGATVVPATASEANKAGLAAYYDTNLKGQSGDAIKFVCNKDNKIYRAYVTESKLAKVNSVNSDKVSLSNVGSIKFEDNNIYNGIKKDDVVVVTTYFNSSATADNAYSVVEKAEAVTGKLDGFKLVSGSTAVTKVTVAGTSYDVEKKALVSGLTDDAVTTLGNSNINDEVTLYLVNGYVGAIDAPDTASDYAYVEQANTNNGNDGDLSEFKMKVILADGTEKTVTVDKDSKCTARGDADNNGVQAAGTDIMAGDLVKYASISSSNVMDLDSVIYKTSAGKTGSGAVVYSKDTKTFDGVMTDSAAVLFVKTTGNDYYAYNLRSLNDIKVPASKNYYSVKNSDGKVEVAVVELTGKPSGATSDTVYGIVSADNGVVKVGDDYQKSYLVSNNKGDYKVYMGASSTELSKGDIVYFDQASDDIYADDDVNVITTGVFAKELDNDKVLSYYTSATKTANGYIGGGLVNVALEDDAQIVYVDKDGEKGGDDIGVNEFDKINGYANIAVVTNTSGKVDAIIVETSNEKDIATASKAVLSAKFTNGNDNVTLTVTNSGLTGSITMGDVKDAKGTVVSTMNNSATVTNGTLTITLNENGTSLKAGDYTVTVTDSASPAVSATYTFNVAA